MRRWTQALALLAILAFSLPAEARTLKVVATFSVLAEMVGEVGGEKVEVTTLVGPDSDAHAFEPSPGSVKALAGADMLVANGLGFEPWLDRLLKSSGFKGPVVTASAGVTPLRGGHDHPGGHDHSAPDPHAWQDLANGKRYAANIAAALSAAAPENQAVFQAQAAAYSQRLGALDDWVRSEIGAIPPEKRKIITTHDAFGYFGKAYGIHLLAAQGLSTEAEPTAKDLAALSRQIRAENVRAVFLENMSDPRLIEALAKDTGAVVGGTLYADALSGEDGPAPTYEAMFRHNVGVLTSAMAKN